jgi:hypothetical protein
MNDTHSNEENVITRMFTDNQKAFDFSDLGSNDAIS